ncbi:hypothetical protein B0H67DRAFT_578156 [Lasiosphaeris hirsuta]|uniref:Uncharacterized protein n=1 Tax=Lasiosphaeris hirsuta TaxID=260670 RepID=A0AA40ASC8_9PEZI|nr:hypothetical protein B0H67DRAFT_578156 [Lasiosphaeris hirsuta]
MGCGRRLPSVPAAGGADPERDEGGAGQRGTETSGARIKGLLTAFSAGDTSACI